MRLQIGKKASATEPEPKLLRVFLASMLESPKGRVFERLCDGCLALVLASRERAQRAAANDVRAFTEDLSTLLKAANRIRDRWLLPDHRNSAGGSQFLATMEEGLTGLFTAFTGTAVPVDMFKKRRATEEEYAGPLCECLEYARPSLESPLTTLSSCCTVVLDHMKQEFSDQPIAVSHRPSTAQRDRRLLALHTAGATVREIVRYEGEANGNALTEQAVRAALVRARRSKTKPSASARRSPRTNGL